MYPKMLNKKELIKSLAEELGYEGFIGNTYGHGNYKLEKKYKSGIKEIIVFEEFDDWDKRGMHPYTSACKVFPEVEKIMKKYFKKINYNPEMITIEKHYRPGNRPTIYFPDKESIKDAAKFYDKDFQAVHFPFFKKYQSIEDVYENGMNMTDKELSRLIYAPYDIRFMVIMRLVGDNDWEAYGEKLIEKYSKFVDWPNHGRFIPLIPDLMEGLKKM